MKKTNLLCSSFLILLLSIFNLNFAFAANPAPVTDVYNGGRGTSFNMNWEFFRGDANGANEIVFNDASWRNLSVPHDWSIELPFNRKSASGGGGGYLESVFKVTYFRDYSTSRGINLRDKSSYLYFLL